MNALVQGAPPRRTRPISSRAPLASTRRPRVSLESAKRAEQKHLASLGVSKPSETQQEVHLSRNSGTRQGPSWGARAFPSCSLSPSRA